MDPPDPSIAGVRSRIVPADARARDAARARADRLTMPRGALGRLVEEAVRLCAMAGRIEVPTARRAILTMAADHGVAARGVSAYPREVTPQMVFNFARGGAAVNVLARQAGARVVVVDLGVAGDLRALAVEGRIVSRPVRTGGTSDLSEGPAMTRDEAMRSLSVGMEVAAAEIVRGADLLGVGDMGIGNTTPSAAITAVLCRTDPDGATGRGTGIDDAALARKREAVRRALAVNRPDPADPIDVLAKVGGFEIGGIAGAILEGAARRVPVVLDGFIAGAGALLAQAICPASADYMVAAHRSQEPGHRAALERLGLRPLLDLDLRLGEGTGAALAMPLLASGVAILNEMATFESAGVSGPRPSDRA